MTGAVAVGVSLSEAIRLVEEELAGLRMVGPADVNDWDAAGERRPTALNVAMPRLARTAGAVVTEAWDGASIRCCGIRSTSTSGVEGALSNWLVAARKREAAS